MMALLSLVGTTIIVGVVFIITTRLVNHSLEKGGPHEAITDIINIADAWIILQCLAIGQLELLWCEMEIVEEHLPHDAHFVIAALLVGDVDERIRGLLPALQHI